MQAASHLGVDGRRLWGPGGSSGWCPCNAEAVAAWESWEWRLVIIELSVLFAAQARLHVSARGEGRQDQRGLASMGASYLTYMAVIRTHASCEHTLPVLLLWLDAS